MAIDVRSRRSRQRRSARLSRRSLLAAAAAFIARPAHARNAVSTSLVLASDVSSSVSAERFALQRQGYAAALADPRVIAAIQATSHGAIGLSYFEWASSRRQRVLVPWTRVATLEDGEALAAFLEAAPRPFDGATGLGPAIDFALDLLGASPFVAAEHVIDVSGDGPHNDGAAPPAARDRAAARGVRVNGLPIRGGHQEFPGVITLAEYYEDNVRCGANAFVIEAESFATFGATLVSKLRREIA